PNTKATGFIRGSGVTKDNPISSSDFFTANNWNASNEASARDLDEYIQWSLQPLSNFYHTISELDIAIRRDINGPQFFVIYYSVNNFVSYTPATEVIAVSDTEIHEFTFSNLNITTPVAAKVTFRL